MAKLPRAAFCLSEMREDMLKRKLKNDGVDAKSFENKLRVLF